MLNLARKKMFTQQCLVGTGFSSTVLVSMVNMLNLAHKKMFTQQCLVGTRFLKYSTCQHGKHVESRS